MPKPCSSLKWHKECHRLATLFRPDSSGDRPLAVLVGIVLGATAIKGLNAQAKPPGYYVFNIEVTDPQGYQAVLDRTPTSLVPYGGRFIIRGAMPELLEGARLQRFGIIAFDSIEKARAWNDSPANKEITAIRARTSKSHSIFLIEGASN